LREKMKGKWTLDFTEIHIKLLTHVLTHKTFMNRKYIFMITTTFTVEDKGPETKLLQPYSKNAYYKI
jgi:hypothetical protein